jgi:membrane-bound lytic murein transglycosylase D
MKHCRQPSFAVLISLIAGFMLAGCQSLPSLKQDGSDDLNGEAKEQVAKAEILVPTDPKIDQAEAEFERSILAQTDNQSHLLEKIQQAPREQVWDELADRFTMIDEHHNDYQDYLAFYLNNAKHLERVSVRAKPYLYFIMEELRAREMPFEIAMLPIIESAYYPYAHSRMRAAGLWQFIPTTGRIYGLKQDWWYDGRQDVYLSTHAALDFLQNLYELNNQDWLLALASYNAGYGRIQQATKRLKRKDPNAEVTYWSIRPYLPRETRHYVPQLLAVSYLIKNRQKYNINIQPVPNEPYLTYVELDRQMDLNKAAEMLDISTSMMKHLNPGYLKTVTPPDGPHHLLIPLQHKDAFEQKLAENHDLFDIRWQRHYIVSGDTLGTIAQRYRTSVREIQRLNNISSHVIRAGRTLLIPIPAKHAQEVTQYAQKQDNKPTSKAKRIHYVQRGESLWTIANYYGLETSQLAQWNKLNPRQPIRVGQRLEIHSDKYGHTIEHQVANGESLWLIARRYQVTIRDITRWNNISSKTHLQPGDKLTIWRSGPPDLYTVQEGDTLWDIARAFNVNSEKLKQHNKLSQNQFLMPGQVLRIPNDS